MVERGVRLADQGIGEALSGCFGLVVEPGDLAEQQVRMGACGIEIARLREGGGRVASRGRHRRVQVGGRLRIGCAGALLFEQEPEPVEGHAPEQHVGSWPGRVSFRAGTRVSFRRRYVALEVACLRQQQQRFFVVRHLGQHALGDLRSFRPADLGMQGVPGFGAQDQGARQHGAHLDCVGERASGTVEQLQCLVAAPAAAEASAGGDDPVDALRLGLVEQQEGVGRVAEPAGVLGGEGALAQGVAIGILLRHRGGEDAEGQEPGQGSAVGHRHLPCSFRSASRRCAQAPPRGPG